MTPAQERAFRELWPRFGVDWTPGRALDLTGLFARHAPVYLEIGFGNGEALFESARRNPHHNYLGVEVHRPGIGTLLRALDREGLMNVRVLRQDAAVLLAEGLPGASLAGVALWFPDPWPKKRHHKRRLLSSHTLPLLARVLAPGGVLEFATDWEPYAQEALALLDGAVAEFANLAGPGCFAERSPERPLTRFERRGQALGHVVRELRFVRRASTLHPSGLELCPDEPAHGASASDPSAVASGQGQRAHGASQLDLSGVET